MCAQKNSMRNVELPGQKGHHKRRQLKGNLPVQSPLQNSEFFETRNSDVTKIPETTTRIVLVCCACGATNTCEVSPPSQVGKVMAHQKKTPGRGKGRSTKHFMRNEKKQSEAKRNTPAPKRRSRNNYQRTASKTLWIPKNQKWIYQRLGKTWKPKEQEPLPPNSQKTQGPRDLKAAEPDVRTVPSTTPPPTPNPEPRLLKKSSGLRYGFLLPRPKSEKNKPTQQDVEVPDAQAKKLPTKHPTRPPEPEAHPTETRPPEPEGRPPETTGTRRRSRNTPWSEEETTFLLKLTDRFTNLRPGEKWEKVSKSMKNRTPNMCRLRHVFVTKQKHQKYQDRVLKGVEVEA
eukprot:GHVO01006334.1.p1 GENE.GHVO01006334.1~~GHVO01006334.1.p1  ORF type:complete len:344 (-),score=25.29 GHVO01006334.1:90-1121(-)